MYSNGIDKPFKQIRKANPAGMNPTSPWQESAKKPERSGQILLKLL
jgi:hypothetical protein